MRLSHAEIMVARVPLRYRIRHASHERQENETGFVLLEAADGTQGCGEFLSRSYVTGESFSDCLSLGKRLLTDLLHEPLADPHEAIPNLLARYTNEPGVWGALCGIDLALVDLWCRQRQLSIASWLHQPPPCDRSLVYSAVYPLASGWKRKLLHLGIRWMGMRFVKVKGTGQAANDLAYLAEIARWLPAGVDLRIDLNGSLTTAAAGDYLTQLDRAQPRLEWIEQPFAKDAWETSARFQREFAGRFLFCADESVCTPAELERAAESGAFRAVNLRIAKHGGLTTAWQMYERARALGLATQLGCLVGETSILATAGAHLAALGTDLRYLEGCFGRLLLAWDVLRSPLSFGRGGTVPVASLPDVGLNLPIDLARLRSRAIAVHEIEI